MIKAKVGFVVYGVHKDGLKDPDGNLFIDYDIIERSRKALRDSGLTLVEGRDVLEAKGIKVEHDNDIVATKKEANEIILPSGLTIFILYMLTGDRGVSTALHSINMPKVNIPLLKDIPFLGEVLSGHNVLTYMAVVVVVLVAILLYKTKLGIYIRAVGESPKAIETAGFSSRRIRLYALIISGVIAGMGGAFMSMAYVSGFTKDMISGRGFIALAAEAMGCGKPLLSSLAALLFGFTDSLANNLQVLGLSSDLARMFPYVITIVALSIYASKTARGIRKTKKRHAAK